MAAASFLTYWHSFWINPHNSRINLPFFIRNLQQQNLRTMAEIRLTVDEQFIDGLKKDTGIDKASQLTSDALTLLKWAVGEVKKGRVLISTDEHGGDAKRIVMPALEMAKAKE
jgi:hypothetical protein